MDTSIVLGIEQKRGLTVESGLYLLAFLAALILRLVILGQHPLTEHEAGYAWQAFQAAHGEDFLMLGHPAYIQSTAGLFFLLGSSDMLARLLPAVVGSAVVLLPYMLRQRIGHRSALVAAFGLAFDPISIAVSRQAGSPAMVLGFLALAWFLWDKKRFTASGLFIGMLIMSGISFVFGLVAGLISIAAIRYLFNSEISVGLETEQWRQAMIGVVIALLTVGTLFTTEMQGLAAAAQAIPDYISGWFSLSSTVTKVSVWQVLIALLVYQPLGLVFALLVWFNRRFETEYNLGLTALFLVVLGMILIYPTRQVWMLTWAVIPLWMLAGQVIGEYLDQPEEQDRNLVWGEAVFYLVLLTYWWLNLSKMTALPVFAIPEGVSLSQYLSLDTSARIYFVRLLVTVFTPVLILVITAFVARGWPGEAPLQGALWGIGIFLGFYIVMAGMGFSRSQAGLAGELWVQQPSVGYSDEMMAAIEELSVQTTGDRRQLRLTYQVNSPLVRWLLRDFPNAHYSPQVPSSQLPDAVLNQDLGFVDTATGQFFAGQHFVLSMQRQWGQQPIPGDFDRWLVYRESPVQKNWVYLWTRADLFPLYEPEPVE